MRWSSCVVVLALALVGCDSSSSGAGADTGSGGRDATTPPTPPGAAGGGLDGTAPPTPPTPPPPPTGAALPCEVDEVLRTVCQRCHSDPTMNGAPMPLTSYDRTQSPAVSDPSLLVWQMMQRRVNDPLDPMPPDVPLADAQKAALNAWFAAGAPMRAAGTSCDAPPPTPPPPPPPPVGPDALPCTPSHRFLAHDPGTTDGYPVPVDAHNLYQCFTFRSPFTATDQAIAWAPVTGDPRVVHHWILYRTSTPQTDGAVGPCNMPGDAAFVMGWAPGGENFVMPPDVGLELSRPGDSFLLQIHYYNIAGLTDSVDASGVAICTADSPRPQTAATLWFGTPSIDIPPRAVDHPVQGYCPSAGTRLLSGPLHFISSAPHMHQLGTRFLTEIWRGGDSSRRETLVSVDRWDFNAQRHYPHSPAVTLNPGDEVRTTCWYTNPSSERVRFGERTEDEMCFNFIMAYPISVLPADNRHCELPVP